MDFPVIAINLGLTINWNAPGSTELVFSVINTFEFNSTQGGISTSFWLHFSPGSSSSLLMPASLDALPMFAVGALYELQVETIQLNGTLNYNQLFDFNIGVNADNLFFNSSSESGIATQRFSIAP